MRGEDDASSAWAAFESATLTRSTTPVRLSRTNTSLTLFVSSSTRLEALDEKATKRPSPLSTGSELPELPWTPLPLTLARTIQVQPEAATARIARATIVVRPIGSPLLQPPRSVASTPDPGQRREADRSAAPCTSASNRRWCTG